MTKLNQQKHTTSIQLYLLFIFEILAPVFAQTLRMPMIIFLFSSSDMGILLFFYVKEKMREKNSRLNLVERVKNDEKRKKTSSKTLKLKYCCAQQCDSDHRNLSTVC